MSEFFKRHGGYVIRSFFYENDGVFTVEELYQEFKARLVAELMVDVHGASHYGRLVERSDGDSHE